MRSLIVVSTLPRFQLAGQAISVVERLEVAELPLSGLVAELELAIDFRISRWDATMGNAQIRQLPDKLGPNRRVVIDLDPWMAKDHFRRSSSSKAKTERVLS